MLSAPRHTAPAAWSRVTAVASAVAGGSSRLIFEPAAGPFAAFSQDGLFQGAQGVHRDLRRSG